MNNNVIRVPSLQQISWSTANAQEKEADFLSLRLLNKRTRIRISPRALDLDVLDGKGNYFVVSNLKGWFVAIVRGVSGEYKLALSLLSDLRESIVSSKVEGEDELAAKRIMPVAGAPTHLALALNDERLVVGFSDGSLSIFDSASVFSSGGGNIAPLHTFPPVPPGALRQILGNPGDLPELVAVRRDPRSGSNGLAVEIIDVKQLQSVGGWQTAGTSESVPTSIVWSAKGKQLAIGLRNGEIVTYSPSDTSTVKLHVPRPPSVGDSSIITVLWLTNQAFYGIYAPPDNTSSEAPQKHVLTTFDPKTNSATQTELETPYYPSPALRPPGAFTVIMRNWTPAKHLIFVGDSTSSDIGLVGSLTGNDASDTWFNLTLEETSTPSVPLDSEAEDTVPLALDIDLTRDPGEQANSALPVLYLYASDGTLQAWHLSNEKGGPYSAMIVPSLPSASSASQPMQSDVSQPAFAQTNASTFGSSAFGQQSSTPAFGQTSAFGRAPGTSTFGGSAQSAFGQTPATGFGAFASSSTPTFGSASFGFGNALPSPGPASLPATNAASPEAEMSEADEGEADKIGGLSLGGSGDSSKTEGRSANSIFGSFAMGGTQPAPTTSASGNGASSFGAFGNIQGSGLVKPASGFAAFLKPAESQASPKTEVADQETKPSSAFGTSGFTTPKAQPAFGQPAFGQSSFGSPTAFGLSPASSAEAGTSGAFSAFAGSSKGFSAFSQGATTGFGQQAQALQSKPSDAPSIAMATSSDGTGKVTNAFSTSDQKLSRESMLINGSSTPINSIAASGNSFFGAGTSTQGSSGFGDSQSSPSATQKQQPSPFRTPSARGVRTPVSSPEGSPSLEQKPKPEILKEDSFTDVGEGSTFIHSPSVESTTPFGTPAPAVFRPSGAVPSSGAFGNLTSTPSAFKPAEGFGAFGASASASSTSPFANPKPVGVTAFSTPVKPASAFGAGGSGPANAFQTASTTPMFGTPTTPNASVFGQSSFGTPSTPNASAFGKSSFGTPSTPSASAFGKSSFGTPTTPTLGSTTPLATPAGSVLGAYSGSGGFSAFAKAGKSASFSELLKSAKDDDGETTKSKTPAGGKEAEKDESSFVTFTKPESDELDHDNLPPTPSTHGTFDDEDQNLGDEQGERDDAESFLSESFSNGSKGEEEKEEEDEEEEEEEEEEEDDDDDDEEDGEDAEAEGSDDDESEVSERGQAPETDLPLRTKSLSPASIPLPLTREVTPKSREGSPSPENASLQASTPSTEQTKSALLPSKVVVSKAKSPTPIITKLPDEDEEEKKSAAMKSPPPLFAKAGTSGMPTLFGRPVAGTEKADSAKPAFQSVFSKPAAPSGDSVAKQAPQGVLSTPFSTVQSTTPPYSPSEQEDEGPLPAPKVAGPVMTSATSLGMGRPISRPIRSSPLASTPILGEDPKSSPAVQTSQSAPILPRARPASPRLPFGHPAAGQQGSMQLSRPKIGESPPQSAPLVPSAFTVPPSTAISFGSTAQSTSNIPSVFRPPSSTTAFSAAGNAPFIMPSSAPTTLNNRPGMMAPPSTGFNRPGAGPHINQPSEKRLPVQATFESSMQRECQVLCTSMIEEFERLAMMSKAAVAMRTTLGRISPVAHSREEFKDKTKWSFGDLEVFRKLIKGLEKDLLEAYQLKDALAPLVRAVESNLLKAETRKEEIVRFYRAKADPDFAKMLNGRTLGPDVAETQNQLRRQIRLINDRVEQLELHLQSCKKKLQEHKKGKSSIKPPSLDTINRTYRNIDLAVELQIRQIEALTSRIAKLDVGTLDTALHGSPSPSRRKITKKGGLYSSIDDPRDDGKETGFRPQVTPSIAASTAAALNAERSALRLKNALLKVRKTPLLNTQAAEPSRRVPPLETLPKGGSSSSSKSGTEGAHPFVLDSNLDCLRERQQESAGVNRRRPHRHSTHDNNVKLGRTNVQVPQSIVQFDWGPLPKAKPMTTLPSDIRPESIGRKTSL